MRELSEDARRERRAFARMENLTPGTAGSTFRPPVHLRCIWSVTPPPAPSFAFDKVCDKARDNVGSLDFSKSLSEPCTVTLPPQAGARFSMRPPRTPLSLRLRAACDTGGI